MRRHFILITDQQSVAFMFNQKHHSKKKNKKMERWRLEMSCYKYEIIYRPEKDNVAANALSRVCAFVMLSKLNELHNSLGHSSWYRKNGLMGAYKEPTVFTQ